MSNEAEETLEKIANTTDLDIAIRRLESRRLLQEESLKVKSHELLISLKPSNILKHTLSEVRESTPLQHNLFKVALGLGAGYLSRKMVVGKSAGLLKKALGTAVQYGITHFVAKKDDDDTQVHTNKRGFFKKLLAKIR
jgi:hypothetical protein